MIYQMQIKQKLVTLEEMIDFIKLSQVITLI